MAYLPIYFDVFKSNKNRHIKNIQIVKIFGNIEMISN